ncbi:SMP-30/gluconolactonase/LRE family protein [Alphaproteobacteria bacterium]|nr:SMP-30/gluconolactonase/LRE family protein [Alphaproteobacteria bacterium]
MFDFDILDSKTLLGESGFYLYKTNEIVFLDLLNPSIFFYSIKEKTLSKEKLNLLKPLGNIYPMDNGQFIISNLDGLHIYNRNKKTIKYFQDIREADELYKISYNDGTITKNKLWIGLSHIKETKNIGYFGYLQNNKFNKLDQGFKVSNGPAVDEKQNKLYFSNSLNSTIYQYNLKTLKKKLIYKLKKNKGFPDGIALDNKNGLWVAHWAGGQISRINLKTKKIDVEIKIPALNVTSVTFVGKKLNHIFVTSAKIETSKTQLQTYKYSGSSFIIKTNFTGQKISYSNLNQQ